MTTSIDVPRAQWRAFLDAFAAAHQDWLVNVAVAERLAGAPGGVRETALGAIRMQEDTAGHASVTIETNGGEGVRAAHTVEDVSRVQVLKREDGAESALALDGARGAHLLMHFLAPQPVEGVDAILRP